MPLKYFFALVILIIASIVTFLALDQKEMVHNADNQNLAIEQLAESDISTDMVIDTKPLNVEKISSKININSKTNTNSEQSNLQASERIDNSNTIDVLEKQKQAFLDEIFDPNNQINRLQLSISKTTRENSQVYRANDENYILLTQTERGEYKIEYFLLDGKWQTLTTYKLDEGVSTEEVLEEYYEKIENQLSIDKGHSRKNYYSHRWDVASSQQPFKRHESTILNPSMHSISSDLKACIIQSNSIPSVAADSLTINEILNITAIECNGNVDLSGIENWDHIQYLALYNIDDINPFMSAINQLINLQALTISSPIDKTNFIDFENISNLTQLTSLKLERVSIKNEYSIKNFEQLMSIEINESFLSSLDFLSNLYLNEMKITQSQITSFDYFNENGYLEAIDLSDNLLNDISGLANFKDLKYLDLRNNNFSLIESIHKPRDIDELFLSGNNIKDCHLLGNEKYIKYTKCE